MTADALITLNLGRQYPPPAAPATPANPNSKGFISGKSTSSKGPSLVNATTLKTGNGAEAGAGRVGSALTVAVALLALAVSAAVSMGF
jgi:hypothetical protein